MAEVGHPFEAKFGGASLTFQAPLSQTVAQLRQFIANKFLLGSCKLIGLKEKGSKSASAGDDVLLSNCALNKPHRLMVVGVALSTLEREKALQPRRAQVDEDTEEELDYEKILETQNAEIKALEDTIRRNNRVTARGTKPFGELTAEQKRQNLELAALFGNLEEVKRLCDSSVALYRAAELAVINNHLQTFIFLCQKGATRSAGIEALIEKAAEYGRIAFVEFLCRGSTAIDFRAALSIAAGRGHLQMLKWLHKRGAPMRLDSLIAAAAHGHVKILTWLMSHEAPVTREVLEAAVAKSQIAVLDVLCKKASPETIDKAFLTAVSRGDVNVAQHLLREHKANAETEKGAALLLASTHGELPLVQFVVQSLIARRYDEGKQKIAHALEVSPSNAAAAAAAADTPAKGKKESKRRGSGKDEKQTQMETETEPEAETEPASAKSSVGVLVPEFAREVGLSVSDVAAAAALEGKEEKTEQRAQPLLRKLLKRQQRKAAKQRGAVDAEGLDTDSEDEDEDDNENKEKNETESGLSTELLRDCVKAAAERSDADVVEYLLTVGAASVVDLSQFRPTAQMCVVQALVQREENEQYAEFAATRVADAFRSLLKMSRDVVRVVLGYLLGTEGRNAVRFAQETERILKTGPERLWQEYLARFAPRALAAPAAAGSDPASASASGSAALSAESKDAKENGESSEGKRRPVPMLSAPVAMQLQEQDWEAAQAAEDARRFHEERIRLKNKRKLEEEEKQKKRDDRE